MEEIATLVGIAVPLFGIAGSAVAYVVQLYRDRAAERRRDFFALMAAIDSRDPIAGKVSAVYQLRFFPEHKEFILRFCEAQRANVDGPAKEILINELNNTRNYFISGKGSF